MLVSLDDKEVFDLINSVRFEAEKKFGTLIEFGIDAAASSFFKKGKYNYMDKKISENEQYKLIESCTMLLNKKYLSFKGNGDIKLSCSEKTNKNTDRTVIGAQTERAKKVMRKLYGHLNAPIVETDLRSAEMIKYASNAFLATKISFINEIAYYFKCLRIYFKRFSTSPLMI